MYLELIKICEKVAFRVYRLMERRSDAGQSRLFNAGHRLYTNPSSQPGTITQLIGILRDYCSDSAFADELRKEGNWYEWAGLKYFLYEYEEHLAESKGATPKILWSEINNRNLADSIEHILPQTPTSHYWTQRFNENYRTLHTHDLGNLVLTKHNSEYGNKPFPEKRGELGADYRCYAQSPFYMEQQLAVNQNWTVDTLRHRKNVQVEWAIQRWHVEMGDATLSDNDDGQDRIPD